ncbi:type VII secretion protein EccCa [Actinomadura algeriensis]|uniref:S-DNA-T family DNA segregation ATPase FtsK/SpoIIIE n=1 Tax=Actinomadura algeriensis TaxID=1679523 RepID=A0ABR9JTV3_9ACTN|nr:type VII secretion protein EccCa [Actinomadura algeriensis]MBE1533994.1 S-DNA-T family DNA segregation ATPase FtsK/SpoIIIE [Actinomadura algeriensis]
MSRIAFHRPARMAPPPVPEDKLSIAAPPQMQPQNTMSSMVMLLLPLLTSVSMAAYLVSTGRRWMIILGVVFVVSAVGLTVGVHMQTRGRNRRTRDRHRERYLEYLGDIRGQARDVARVQRFAAAWVHPSPERLWAIAERRRRVWERRPGDPDHLRVRVGTGNGPLALTMTTNRRSDPSVEYDPRSLHAAEELVQTHGTVEGQPAWIDLGRAGVVSLLGPAAQTEAAAAALLCQLAVLHAPDDVQIAVVTAGDPAWEWAKWLPHTFEPDARDRDTEVVPLVAERLDGLADHLEAALDRAVAARAARGTRLISMTSEEPPGQRLVMVLNGYDPRTVWAQSPLVVRLIAEAGAQLGITVVCVVTEEAHEPERVDVRVRVDARGRATLEGPHAGLRADVKDVTVDRPSPALRSRVARALAPLRLSGEQDQVLAQSVSLPGMLGIGDLSSLDPSAAWRGPDDEELLRVPVGVSGDGEALVLDLKESAQGGIGPHGLVVGATGSGKSELLRTLVTGLAVTHSPEHLGFVLVDFKGGATFAGLTGLPHVAGLITNLSDELALVERVRAALAGEQQRRQRLLRRAGNVDSIRDYQRKQAAGGTDVDGVPLPPLPYLMIVVDEFGELLSQQSDFIDLFVQIGRVGRSLGMHLLLATQRLEEGRLRGLESHLSYRIALRTFSAAESRAVLGSPDAYRLPSIPGSAYLKVDESVFERFRVAHVSRLYETAAPDEGRAAPVRPVPYGLRTPPVPDEPAPRPVRAAAPETGTTELEVVVERLAASSAPTHQVWLPPLPAAYPLDPLLAPAGPVDGRGLQSQVWPTPGRLNFPVAVADLPARQEQRPLVLDLAGLHGHLVLVGAPQSGKSTFLRTMLISAMLTHTPDELQFYCVDHGGGGLHAFADAPHVSGVASRRDPERVRRVLTEVTRLVDVRERMFAELGVQSAADFRRARDAGALPDGVRAADVVLVIDNWGAMRTEMEDASAIVTDITTRGLGVGVHVVLTAGRWAELRPALRDSIPGRLELNLNDPAESEINRKETRRIGRVPPGRGLMPPGVPVHIPLPRLDASDGVDDLTEAQQRLLTEIAAAWEGPAAPPLKVLPERVTVAELAEIAAGGGVRDPWEDDGRGLTETEVPIGLSQRDLRPVGLDLTAGRPHFLLFGDAGAGKTSFLRAWMRGVARRHSPWDVRFIVVDYRRSLLDVVPEPYIGAHAGNPELAETFVDQVVAKLRERMPPADLDSRRLRDRDWWQGPEFYLVVDDYDLVADGPGRGPLAPLAAFVGQGEELGFHVVLARRVSGASRTLMADPLLGRLREFGSDGLILSGDPREGALLGDQRAAQRVPGRGVLVRRRTSPEPIHAVLDEENETLTYELGSVDSPEEVGAWPTT